VPPARRIRPYDVFLSYASEDEPQARALQLGLQRLAKPWYSLQALRVFRDRTALPVGDGLWSALKVRLEKSDWLVLLASPEAADSKWVECEVRWWRDHNTEDGAVESFDTLLLATGSSAIMPPIEGIDKEGIFPFRTLDDTRALLHRAGPGVKAVVIGGGLLGLEAARGLQVQGCHVTVVHLFPALMERQLDPAGGSYLKGEAVHTLN